jgi:putative peptidoglycan lipid II flippase
VVSGMTSLSRILGLVRDVVIARVFGAGAEMDAFIMAFRIPNFLRRVFADGGFAPAFVPVLSEYRASRSADELRALVDQTTATLGLVVAIITALGIVAAPVVVVLFAPGFLGDAGKLELTAEMLRITFPYILFIALTGLAGGILNTFRQFAVPAFTPVLLNLALIGCALWLAPHLDQPVVALAWGVFLGGLAQLLLQLPPLARLKLIPRPAFGRDREGVRRIVRLMVPALFAGSVSQINLLISSVLSSFLITGSISWLYYADRLMEFPLGVFGIALATVILPSLSADHTRGSAADYTGTLNWALRWVFLISVPAALGLILLAGPALVTLFQYQRFSSFDVQMTALALIAFAVGLPAHVLVRVLSSGFFSKQDTRTPVNAGMLALGVNLVLNLALMVPMAHAGLALATSLAAIANAAFLYWHLRRRGWYAPGGGWGVFLLRIGAGAAAMCLLLVLVVPDLDAWYEWSALHRALNLCAWVLAGAASYFAMLWCAGLRPAAMIARG